MLKYGSLPNPIPPPTATQFKQSALFYQYWKASFKHSLKSLVMKFLLNYILSSPCLFWLLIMQVIL